MTTSESIMSKGADLRSSIARAALSQTVASCPASRNARASEASVFASSSTINRCAKSESIQFVDGLQSARGCHPRRIQISPEDGLQLAMAGLERWPAVRPTLVAQAEGQLNQSRIVKL